MLRLTLLFVFYAYYVTCRDNGLVLTPPMGWSTWNTFRCFYNESTIMEMADVMVSSGLAAAGYEFINIDDCWQECYQTDEQGHCTDRAERDDQGRITPDPKKFPSGFNALADYIHSKNLKFGLYSSSGNLTCANYTGSWGYEEIDAIMYAKWEVDYFKYDCCYTTPEMSKIGYPKMGDALNATGRPIVYSCDTDELMTRVGNKETPWIWAPTVCNLWRIWGDIYDYYYRILEQIDHDVMIAPSAGPGGWNDPDMLTIGMGRQTTQEYRSQFAMWAILAAPLILGNDIRNMSQETIDILTNKYIISVNQDPLGIQGSKVRTGNCTEVWARPLSDGSTAIALFNRDATEPTQIWVHFEDLFSNWLDTWQPPILPEVEVTDLWTGEYLGNFTHSYSTIVDVHDTAIIRISKPF